MGQAEVLVVANAPSDNTRALARAVVRGASHPDFEGAVAARWVAPLEAGVEDVLGADAVVLGTTENFGYMSGQLKDFLERIYYPCLERTAALPWALYVRAGKDGTGTERAVKAIVGGLRWREAQPARILRGGWREEFVEECEEVGMAVAAALWLSV